MQKNNAFYTPIFFILLVVFFCSCVKHNSPPPCSGNCVDVTFSGNIFDATNNKPIVNHLVNVELNQNAYCIYCSSYKLASGNTNNSGQFSLKSTFDSTMIHTYHISVNTTTPPNYLTYTYPAGADINPPSTANTITLSDIDPASTQNLNFVFYLQTLLHLNMHRTGNIPQNPSLDLEFGFNGPVNSIWGLYQTNNNKDTTLTVYTAANIYTKIIATNTVTADSFARQTDSIKCGLGVNNSIDIYY